MRRRRGGNSWTRSSRTSDDEMILPADLAKNHLNSAACRNEWLELAMSDRLLHNPDSLVLISKCRRRVKSSKVENTGIERLYFSREQRAAHVRAYRHSKKHNIWPAIYVAVTPATMMNYPREFHSFHRQPQKTTLDSLKIWRGWASFHKHKHYRINLAGHSSPHINIVVGVDVVEVKVGSGFTYPTPPVSNQTMKRQRLQWGILRH